MLQDRDQKQKALTLSLANRWFPQLEVDVQPTRAVREKAPTVTDLDVFSSIPDQFNGYRTVIFDCKTKARESAINRALWMSGLLERLRADQGICVLKKDAIELDHRLFATRLKVILLAEDEFDLYARATTQNYSMKVGNVAEMVAWEQFFEIPTKFARLGPGVHFTRSYYWMIDDPAEACRKTLSQVRAIHPELDPARPEHLALFLDLCALFARSLAIAVCHMFKAYLHPANQADLSEALLVMLYGGREAYEYRNELYKRFKAHPQDHAVAVDLSLPEWDRFLQLTRQLLDAPTEAQKVPLILREVGFSFLCADTVRAFAKTLCAESPQAARFSLLVVDYLSKAGKLPPEFGKIVDSALLALQPVK
jgi:hypothetical protein